MTNLFDLEEILYLTILLSGLVIVAGGVGWVLHRLITSAQVYARQRVAGVRVAEAEAERLQADIELVRPDSITGLLPISRAAVEVSTAQILTIMLARIETMRLPDPVPQQIHYAPHYARIEPSPVPQIEGPVEQAAVPIEQWDLWQLYHAGQLPEHGFLLGHNLDTGEPILADWLQLYSALVGGTSGSGKSTLIRSVLLQSALQNGRFVVLDRHYGAGEESLGASLQPLRSLMPFDVAANERQMVDALRYVLDVGRRRLKGDPDRTPLVMVVDETTALFQRSDIAGELATVLGEISQETRKAGVYALCIGQNFSGEVMKTTVRNSFASFFSCRARRDVARVMSGSNRFAQLAEELKIGQAVWLDTAGDVVRLAVPNCTQCHVELVARQCAPTGEWSVPNLLPPVALGPAIGPALGPEGAEDDESGPDDNSEVALTINPQRAALVRQLFKAGQSRTEIIRQVWGLELKQGSRAFKTAARELDEILRTLIP